MMKYCCDMISIKVNGEDYLAVIGGERPPSNNALEQPGAQYSGGRNNEIHFYKLSSGQYNNINNVFYLRTDHYRNFSKNSAL